MTKKHNTNGDLGEALKKLESIVEWFEKQDEVDVEAGLDKVREGAALIKSSRKRLDEVENEFEEVTKLLEEDGEED